MQLLFLLKNVVLLVMGCLLVAYASINITLSPAPADINEMVQNYDKTYALKITPINDSTDETKAEIEISTKNAYILMILAMISGIYLIIYSLSEILICKFL